MILVIHLSTTLAERLVRLSGIPSYTLALFTLNPLTIFFISSQKFEVSQNTRSLVKPFFMVTTIAWFL